MPAKLYVQDSCKYSTIFFLWMRIPVILQVSWSDWVQLLPVHVTSRTLIPVHSVLLPVYALVTNRSKVSNESMFGK
jgi:hypothetical protein